MSKVHLHGQDATGNWIPLRVSTAGDLGGGDADRRTSRWSYAGPTGGITDTADDVVVAAPGVGRANYITALQIANASGTATEVVLKSASTVIWRGYAPANGVQVVADFASQPLAGGNDEAINVACITNSTATLVNAQGYADKAAAQLAADLTLREEIFAEDGTLLLVTSGGATIFLN